MITHPFPQIVANFDVNLMKNESIGSRYHHTVSGLQLHSIYYIYVTYIKSHFSHRYQYSNQSNWINTSLI